MFHIDNDVARAILSGFLLSMPPKRIREARHALRNQLLIVQGLPAVHSSDARTLTKAIDVLTRAEVEIRSKRAA